MRKLWVVLVFVLLASGLAKTTINYFSFTTDQNHVKDLEALIAAFEKENPDLEVKYTTAPFDSYFTKLQTNLAAGQAPDVFELNYENFVTFASRGTLLALDPYLHQDRTLNNAFYPAALNAFRHGNVQYGLPITFSTVVLFYNKDLFDKAGVAYPTASWTWKDVMSAAQKISNPAQRVGRVPAGAVLGVLQGRPPGRRRLAGKPQRADRHPGQPRGPALPGGQGAAEGHALRRRDERALQRGPLPQWPARHALQRHLDVRQVQPGQVQMGH
ncbi:MAG: hypothetical protein C4321_06935 [Chloroflexota bacterium]